MDTFRWDAHFLTGIAAVDEQHQQMVLLVDALGQTLAGSHPADGRPHAAFDRLVVCAKAHFRAEEALMSTAGLAPAYLSLHAHQHADFWRHLHLLWGTRDAMGDPAVVLQGFLHAWLVMHILGEDHSMARQLLAIRDGMSAEDAYCSEAGNGDQATAALLRTIKDLHGMLAQQNTQLVSANQQLEARVLERTRELAALNKRLEVLSNSDALLGIANRRHFDSRLDAEWRRGARECFPLSLLMIDVDHFKRYNDRHGHLAGDRCLQQVARAAGSPPALKRPADLLARYGGEELVVLLPDTPVGGAWAVATEIQRALSVLHLPHGDSPVASVVTVSIGVSSLVPTPGAAADALLEAADAALYAAKAAGRNRVVVHSGARAPEPAPDADSIAAS